MVAGKGSSFQEAVFGYGIQRDERQDNRGPADVCLVFRICSIAAVLPEFQSSGAAEHDIDNAEVPETRWSPLPAGERADARDEATCPEQDFGKVVRAADHTVETGIAETVGAFLLGGGLLMVGRGFQNQGNEHDRSPYASPYRAGVACGSWARGIIIHPVKDRGDLADIQDHDADPDGTLGSRSHFLGGLGQGGEFLAVGRAAQFAMEQESAQAAAVGDEQQAEQERGHGEVLPEEDGKGDAHGGNGKAIAQGDEIKEFLPA